MIVWRLTLLPDVNLNRITNVATVRQYSPFRYPGGKTWLVPLVVRWLHHRPARPMHFIEPFAGGAIVGLTVAIENLAEHVTLVEIDEQVAAVWKTLIYGDYRWLAERIAGFEMTPAQVEAVLSERPASIEERAFQTIVRNRVNRGGILAPGAGRIKQGENGKGLKSRWYPQTLCKRILKIGEARARMTFIEGDGLQVLEQHASLPETVYFIDPPYTAAGKKAGTRLYTHYEVDHAKLFALVASMRGDFLMTYDNEPTLRELATRHGLMAVAVPMKNTHHQEMTELLIGRSLDWLYA